MMSKKMKEKNREKLNNEIYIAVNRSVPFLTQYTAYDPCIWYHSHSIEL